MYELNKRFSVSHDKFQWILVEVFTPEGGKRYERNKYFGTLEQLSRAIIDSEAKKASESLPKNRVKEVDKIVAYGTMLEGLVKRLESYLKSKGI